MDETDPNSIPSEPEPEKARTRSLLKPEASPPRYMVMDLRIHLNDVKASVPVFDGAWSVFDCGLAQDVENQQSRVRRLKKVGFWTLSLAVHALFMGMAGNVI